MTSTEVQQSGEVTEDELVWSRFGDVELRAHIYRPLASRTAAPLR